MQMLDSALLAGFGIQDNLLKLETGEELIILSIARVLPDQRLVCRCMLNTSEVYAKIFMGNRANIHVAREAWGIKSLQNAHILTPSLLLESVYQNQPVTISAAIQNAQNIDEFILQNDYLARSRMAKCLAKTIAKHHQANLIQTDIHLKNFLVANNQIFTLDGDGIRQTNSASQKQQNLATLFSKFDVLDDDFMQESVEIYCTALSKK